MNEQEAFLTFLKKVNERLTILFSYTIPQGKSVTESDTQLLYELYKLDYDGCLEGMSKEIVDQPVMIQTDIFTTQEAPQLPFSDTKAATNSE